MSNRIQKSFENGKAFIGFVTGGDPSIDYSERFILAMAEAGADIIEIGIPFSDPIAEGPVIQRANIRALSAGATVDDMFELARRVRAKSSLPLVFLTYLNPVFRRGYAEFFKQCAENGVDGVIIPDMPYEEQGEAKPYAVDAGVALISMAAPTSADRAELIARDADGFLYVVSSTGVTGVRNNIGSGFEEIIKNVRACSDIPVVVGFGVSEPAQAREIAKTADGVIVGSAIVKIIEERGSDAADYLSEYVRGMKDAISDIH